MTGLTLLYTSQVVHDFWIINSSIGMTHEYNEFLWRSAIPHAQRPLGVWNFTPVTFKGINSWSARHVCWDGVNIRHIIVPIVPTVCPVAVLGVLTYSISYISHWNRLCINKYIWVTSQAVPGIQSIAQDQQNSGAQKATKNTSPHQQSKKVKSLRKYHPKRCFGLGPQTRKMCLLTVLSCFIGYTFKEVAVNRSSYLLLTFHINKSATCRNVSDCLLVDEHLSCPHAATTTTTTTYSTSNALNQCQRNPPGMVAKRLKKNTDNLCAWPKIKRP